MNARAFKAGVIPTMAELYRRNRPDVPPRFLAWWKPRLQSILGAQADLVFAPVTHTQAEYEQSVRGCESEGCGVLLVLPMAYTPSGVALDSLRATRLPIVILSSAQDMMLPQTITADHLLANQAMHGVQDLASTLWRNGRAFHVVAGHPDDPAFGNKIRAALDSARAAHLLGTGRVGQIGGFFPGMLDFTYDAARARDLLGFTHVQVPPRELIARSGSADAASVREYRRWMASRFVVDTSFTEEELEANARYSLALEQIARDENLDALAMCFTDVIDAGAETLPFLGAGRLLAGGVGYAGEGDVLTALLVAACAAMGAQSTFSELYCPEYGTGGIFLSHMGEGNFALAARRHPVTLAPKTFAWGKCRRPAVPVFQMEPGDVTLVSISESPGAPSERRFRLLATSAEIVECPRYSVPAVPYSMARPAAPLPEFLEQYSLRGGTHHVALLYGKRQEELRLLARLAGMDYECL